MYYVHNERVVQPSLKGNITNIPLILAATLTIAITALTASTILTAIQDSTTDQQIKQEPLQEAQNAIGIFDIGIVIINGSFYLTSIILASKIRTNPVFALPSLLFIGFAVWLSSEIANIYYLFGQTGPLQNAASNFTITSTFMQNLPTITLGLATLLAIVLYTGIGRSRVTV